MWRMELLVYDDAGEVVHGHIWIRHTIPTNEQASQLMGASAGFHAKAVLEAERTSPRRGVDPLPPYHLECVRWVWKRDGC